jgi:hypothetical protein
MFDATDPDSESPRCCEHQWWIERVIVGTDMSITVEKVCTCGAVAVASY